jgi:hypothetical protein
MGMIIYLIQRVPFQLNDEGIEEMEFAMGE